MSNSSKSLFSLSGMRLASALAVSVSTISIMAPTAAAQDEQPASRKLDTIVVSARKVEENLQTSPVAVTALGAGMLEDRQINDVSSLQYSAPNVVIAPLVGNSGSSISIRGQAGTDNTSANDAAVGTYVDGIYMARSSMGFLDLVDVERVEVLRGPQGTLFGRNTTGGALSITTPTPNGDFSGAITGRLGNYNNAELLGHVNVPIVGDQMAARFSFKTASHDGYGKSLATGRELANLDSDFLRGVLYIAPDDANWDLKLSADYYTREGNGPIAAVASSDSSHPICAFVGLCFDSQISDDFYTNYSQRAGFEDISAGGGSVEFKYDFGWAELKSLTGYRTVKNNILTDTDGSMFPVIEFEQNNEQNYQVSQELQLSGSTDKLKWIGGLFYFTEDNDDLTDSSTAYTRGEVENNSYAIFGQATYSITDKLNLTGGLRYTLDERALVGELYRQSGGDPVECAIADEFIADGETTSQLDGVPCLSDQSDEFDYVSYLLNLDYQMTDNLFGYVKTSRAYRSGGFNHRAIGEAYKPEQVTDYELGLKSELFDNRLRANLAVFYTQYEDVQRTSYFTAFEGSSPVPRTFTAAKATIPGVELEISAVPLEGFEVGGSLGIVDPTYDTFIDENDGDRDRSSDPFTYTAQQTYSAYINYSVPFEGGEFKAHVDYGHQGRKWFEYNYGAGNDVFLNREPSYALVNGRLSVQLDSPDIELAVYGKNLTEEEYNTFILDISEFIGTTTAFRGTPRTYGIEITSRF